MSTTTPVSIGVGIDTARYGHHASFLRADRLPATKELKFAESAAGYAQFRQAINQLAQKYAPVHFCIRIDAAGQYAANLEQFVRSLPVDKTISIGQPKQNRDYCKVHFPKRKADSVEAQACARFAIVEQPPPTPQTPPAYAQLRDVCSALEAQVEDSTRLINQLHNRLTRVFPELAMDLPDLSAQWVLRLLAKYPSPAKVAAAHLTSLSGLPHMTEDKAQKVQAAAQHTVASQRGPVAEELIRHSVEAIQRSQKAERRLKDLLTEAYDALPDGPHRRIDTIPGIGAQTAAALVAKMVSIDRFAKPDSLINFFGIFPEENTSGVDKHGRPVPPGTMRMSPKGNDLVRRCLWNAAKSAILHNPVVRALYARQRAAGKRGDVALGHCMRKLLQQVFALWKTDQPFAVPEAVTSTEVSVAAPQSESTGGRKGAGPERQAVTPVSSNVPSAPDTSNALPKPQPAPASSPATSRVEFAELRSRITIEQVLRQLGAWEHLRGHGVQRRGPCPIHEPSSTDGRSFSVNLDRHIFRCFDATCGAKGNVLDLWAQSRRVTIPEAARELAERFAADTEQRRGTRQGTRQSPRTKGATT